MEGIKSRFISDKKKKAFYRVIKKWLQGEDIGEIEVAINLSSMLTHSLIEVNEKGEDSNKIGLILAGELDVAFQSDSLKELIYGNRRLSEIREDYLERFGEAFGITEG